MALKVSGSLQLVGDRQKPAVITDVPFGAVIQPFRQARPKDVSYPCHQSTNFSRMSGFVTVGCERCQRFHVLVRGLPRVHDG